MNLIDTHAHMYLDHFSNDLQEVISRIKDAGISKVFLPNIDTDTIVPLNKLVTSDPELFMPFMGLHPTSVTNTFENELNTIFDEFEKKHYFGVGEVGIDLYWDKTYLEQQQYALKKQILFALDKKIPVIIHCREAFREITEVLHDINSATFKGVFHAFSGNHEQAEEVIEMGFLLGICGVVTFKNSTLAEVVKKTDLNHLVLETDSPYLTPVPYRGKRNDSSYIPLIAQKIAELKNLTIEEVAETTSKTAFKLIGL